MKAEQRKELETNTLADRMGQVMQRVKTSQRRTFLFYVVILVLILGGLYVAFRWYVTNKVETSKQWIQLYHGSQNNLFSLATKEKDTPAGKSARLQIAWIWYWELGVKMIGTNPAGSIQTFDKCTELYRGVADDCKEDPIFEPQALLGIAVVAESKAVQNQENLSRVAELYEAILTKYKDSAEGKFAQSRLDALKDDTKRREIATTYRELQALLNVRPAQVNIPGLKLPDVPPAPKKKGE